MVSMVELDELLGRVSFDIQEIHARIVSGLWFCAFTMFIGLAILSFLSVLITRVVVTGETSGENLLSSFLFSYLLTVLGGVLLFLPALLAIRYSLSKSQKERKYVPALQDFISWAFFLSFGGLGSLYFSNHITSLDQPFGYTPELTLGNILIAVGALAVYSSIGLALVLNFLLGITTLLSFVSEYYDILLSFGKWLRKFICSSRPILAVKNHHKYCKEKDHTIFSGLVTRLKTRFR